MAIGLRRVGQALAIAVVLSLLSLLAWKLVHERNGGAAAALKRGDHPVAPDFDLARIDRPGRVRLSNLRGKVVVVNLWASWCYPCIKEARVLEEGWQRWRGRDVVFVGVDGQDLVGDARRFIRHERITYPNVHDSNGKVLDAFGWTYFPETYFIRPGGRLDTAVLGQIDRDKLDAGIRGALHS